MINSTERSDILVFNLGEISDISKCFEDFVTQALGFLIRFCSAELRFNKKMINFALDT